MDLLILELVQDRLALCRREVARVRTCNNGKFSFPFSAAAATIGFRLLVRSLEELDEAYEPGSGLGGLGEHERVRDVPRVHEVEEH